MATSGVAMNDSDDDCSDAQSCFSNEEDFSDDDDVDYLALEVVNYLPEDKASKLMNNLRTKERAIQDLLRRNQSLLEMCDKLDKENQSTTERCDELSKRAEAAETPASDAKSTPAIATPEPKKESKGPKVDTSYFDKLEQRKEETIANLTAENQRLAMINRRCQEQVAQMDARMQELVKESKQLRKKFQDNDRRAASSSANVTNNCAEIDEEERLYQELQRNEQADMIARRMKEQMLEQRKKLAQMLEQVLTRDVLGALCGWDSELSALDMQVEGVEKSIGSVNKGLRGANSAESAATGGKKKQNKKGEDACLDSGWVDETSSQLLDLFEAMRANLDVVDVARHALEEACQRLSDGSCVEILNVMDGEGTLNDAEEEAEHIREQNAAVVERLSSNDIRQGLEFIEQVMSASQLPPGILPPNIEQLLAGNVDKLLNLKKILTSQSSLMEALHTDSVQIGRQVKTLQTGLKTHKALLSERILQGFTTTLRPVSDAESRLMDALRKQRGLEDKARKDASDFLEEFSSAVKRAGPSAGASAEVSGPSVGVAKDNCIDAVKGAKDVRASVATLRGGLTRVHKELAGKLSLVLDAIAGEPEPNSGKAREEAAEPSESKDKRKKKGKKGKPQASGREDVSPKNAPTVPEGVRNEPSHGESVREAPSSQDAPTKKEKGSSKPEKDEDAALREEMAKEFSKDGKAEDSRKVVSGKDLLKELKSLKSQSDSLEERMAARLSRKAGASAGEVAVEETEDGVTEAPQAPKVAVKKKKMYA